MYLPEKIIILMGKKGDKASSLGAERNELLLDKLKGIEGITTKKMFGGYGIFHEKKMFGLIDSKGNIFFKADEASKQAFLDKGGEQHSRMPYYSITESVLGDKRTLVRWAKKAIALSKG